MAEESKLRLALQEWDRLAKAADVMCAEGLTFGQVLTLRGKAMEEIIKAARAVVSGSSAVETTPCQHEWVEAIAAPGFARCKRCGEKQEAYVAGRAEVETTTCRIYEYDGAYKCYVHGRQWGAISPVTGPCPGWQPLKAT